MQIYVILLNTHIRVDHIQFPMIKYNIEYFIIIAGKDLLHLSV